MPPPSAASLSAIALSAITFACVLGGVLLGMFLRVALPDDHLGDASKEGVKVAMGLVATMAALVLGLLIASAKNSFDTQNEEVRHSAANVLLLDRTLAQYGPEAKGIRERLRDAVIFRLGLTWPEDRGREVTLESPETTATIEGIEAGIRALSPRDDGQRGLQSRALQIIGDLEQTRWLLFGGLGDSIQLPFLVVLVFWLAVIFASFGLFTPANATVLTGLLVAALSVSASIYLIVELDRPFGGLIKISSAPLLYTLAHLGQ